MEVKVYNWEHFERSTLWFIWFWIVLLIVIWVSLWKMNFFGTIILFLIAGGYILFSLTRNKVVQIAARDAGLVVETRLWTWATLENFWLELISWTTTIKNIIITQKKWDAMIFSFNDTQENIQKFILALEEHIPFVEQPELSSVDKLLRKLKL